MVCVAVAPSNTVTMLFSDIEGSTALLSRLGGDRYAEALDTQRRLLRGAWSQWSGVEMGTEGDSFFVVFNVASHATSAALQAQRDLSAQGWPGGERVTVRMGLHTGEPIAHHDGYVGMDVHRAARIAAAAHGGQVVLSATTTALVSGRLDDDAWLVDLGRHRLKDIPELEHIHQLSGSGLGSAFPPLKSLGTASSLPVPSTPLVGREDELAELLVVAGSDDVRLVTLTGPGGSGKTRLATAVAAERVLVYPDGVYFVPLATVTDQAAMWTTVAEVLGAVGEDRARPRFLDWVRDSRALVVLDNLEQLPDAGAVVGELLAAVHRLDVIATSRRPLHLHGEHEYEVSPLALPTDGGLAAAERSHAVRLFCQHAKLVRSGFALTADNASDVVAICHRLDGMPLAIELAAARVKLLSPAALLARLESTTGLAARDVDRPARQQTLRAAIGWSYQLLPADSQGFFRRLGVFADGADLDAIAAVDPPLSDPLDSVGELVDASLARVTDGPSGEPRISLLQTIRDFALERLDEAGELDETRRLHAEHYLTVAERLDGQFLGDQPLAGASGMDLEQANFRDVLTWALYPWSAPAQPSSRRFVIGLTMCERLYHYWLNGHTAEGRRWCERALEVAADVDCEELATHLIWVGGIRSADGDEPASIQAVTKALDMSRRLDHNWGIVTSLRLLGDGHVDCGEFDLARGLMEESLRQALRDPDLPRSPLLLILSDLAWLEYLSDNLDVAGAYLDEALTLARAGGRHSRTLEVELLLAAIGLAAGELEEASDQLDRLANDPVLQLDTANSCMLLEQYALLCARRGDGYSAARLTGAANKLREQDDLPASPSEHAYLERRLVEARAAFGSSAWEQARQDGSQLTLDEALNEAKGATSSPPAHGPDGRGPSSGGSSAMIR